MGKKEGTNEFRTKKQKYLQYVFLTLRKGSYEFYNVHLKYLIKYFNENQIFDSDEINSLVISDFVFYERCKKILILQLIKEF